MAWLAAAAMEQRDRAAGHACGAPWCVSADPGRLHPDPGEYADRTGRLAALAARALRSREQTPAGERLVFADTEQTELQLRAVMAAESNCCAFLRMDLARIDAGLALDVAGPPDARPIIAELFA